MHWASRSKNELVIEQVTCNLQLLFESCFCSQGATIRKVILQLNNKPGNRMTYNKLYVAFSRATSWDNLRIMPMHSDDPNGLLWLKSFRINNAYYLWRNSIDADTGRFDPERCRLLAAETALRQAAEKAAYQSRMREQRITNAIKYKKRAEADGTDAKTTQQAASPGPPAKRPKPATPLTPAGRAKPGAGKPARTRTPKKTSAELEADRRRAAEALERTQIAKAKLMAAAQVRAEEKRKAEAIRRAMVEAARPQRRIAVLQAIAADLLIADALSAADWLKRVQQRPNRAEVSVAAGLRNAFATLPWVQQHIPHLLWPANATVHPGVANSMHWGQGGVVGLTNTCPLDGSWYLFSLVLSAHAGVRTHYERLVAGQFSPHVSALSPERQANSRNIASAILKAHHYMLVGKFTAARLLIVHELIRANLLRAPDLGREQDDVNLWGQSDMLQDLLDAADPTPFQTRRRYQVRCPNPECIRNVALAAIALDHVSASFVVQPKKDVAPGQNPLSCALDRLRTTGRVFDSCSHAHARAEHRNQPGAEDPGCGLPAHLERVPHVLPLVLNIDVFPSNDDRPEQFYDASADFPARFSVPTAGLGLGLAAGADATYRLAGIILSNLGTHFSLIFNAGTGDQHALFYADFMRARRILPLHDARQCLNTFKVQRAIYALL